jgi:Tfp pilus assembly protein PilO
VDIPKEIEDSRYANVSLNNQIADQQKQEEIKQALTLSAMPIQVRVKGGFASFVQFLDHLQDYKQLLNIANVEIQSTTDYPLLDCQFTIRIYSLKTLAELKRK